ncbi:MAG TPA: hypothetical protein PK736_01325 [Bacteroidia bacterium]|nr:hypothetical protein [Bacteroidia bacterium]
MKIQRPEQYFEQFSGEQKIILYVLHDFILQHEGVFCRIAYNIPMYYRNGWMCYLNFKKNGDIEFAFTNGVHLPNKNGLLQTNDRKQVAGTFINDAMKINLDALEETMQEAIAFDNIKYKPRKRT